MSAVVVWLDEGGDLHAEEFLLEEEARAWLAEHDARSILVRIDTPRAGVTKLTVEDRT